MQEAFVCPRCGAPMEVSPETIVYICRYCGLPTVLAGIVDPKEIYVAPSLTRDEVISSFNRLLHQDFDLRRLRKDISIFDVEGHYIPVWIGSVHVKGLVEYYVYEEEKRGKNWVRVRRSYTDHVDEELEVPFLGRRQAAGLGIEEMIKSYLKAKPKLSRLVELPPEMWSRIRLDVLNTEVDEREASRRIAEDALDSLRKRYLRRADGIEYFACAAELRGRPKLILLPLWRIYYKYKDSIYQAVFTGWDACCVVRTEPMTLVRRLGYIVGSMGVITLASLAMGLILKFSERVDVIGLLMLGAFLASLSYKLSNKALEDVRVERRR